MKVDLSVVLLLIKYHFENDYEKFKNVCRGIAMTYGDNDAEIYDYIMMFLHEDYLKKINNK